MTNRGNIPEGIVKGKRGNSLTKPRFRPHTSSLVAGAASNPDHIQTLNGA